LVPKLAVMIRPVSMMKWSVGELLVKPVEEVQFDNTQFLSGAAVSV
jgi:hypothetical protein